jgi:NitT/TauT family transport system ATP-binding protein
MMRPKLLLLDEPFGALDPGIRTEIHGLMRGLWHEHAMTVVMVTHDMREAFALATRVIAFDRRRDRPEERERYGATVTNDIAIWPPRVAGRQTIYDADIPAGQDDLLRFAITSGTTRPDPSPHRGDTP